MLDTICVQYPIEISRDFLKDWGYERNQPHGSYTARYRLVVKAHNGCKVTYRYIPQTPRGYPLLQVEFSLPQLVFGDNIYLICDLAGTINQANQMLPSVPGIPQLDLWDGLLFRLDICYNFQVGDLVPFYIQALQPLTFSRRRTRPYTNQGVQFGNRQAAMKFYDKELWYVDNKLPTNPDAHGILRLEVTLRKASLKKLTTQKYPTLRNITVEFVLNTLEDELQHLGLLDRSIGTYDTSLVTLCKTYGTDAGFCYFGALAAGVEYPSREIVVSTSGIHPRSLDRRLKKVMEAGLPLTLTKTEEPLPPLTIDRNKVNETLKQGATVMNY